MDNGLHRHFLTAPILLAALLCGPVHAARADQSFSQSLRSLVGGDSGREQPLDPDKAFRLSAVADGPGSVRLTWEIADGYYLYRDKFSFHSDNDAVPVVQDGIRLPHGEVKQDPDFGRVEVNTGTVDVDVPLKRTAGPAMPLDLTVGYQGCEEGVICYPPISRRVSVVMPSLSATTAGPPPGRGGSETDILAADLGRRSLGIDALVFFGFGLLLAFTPCVFPMVPILSGIIVGQGSGASTGRSALLSIAYVLSMSLAYAVLGVAAGLLNFNLQAAAQSPWIIGAFSALFVLLALSMFGLFQVQWPQPVRNLLAGWNNRVHGGSIHGASLMGVLSAVIVGPCVAPPLAAALLYISQSGNALLGGIALFFLGLGMGAPLLVLGASGGALLPRAGRWMEAVKQVFGVVMLGVAIGFLGRILPGPLTMALWALLLIVSAVFLGALDRLDRPSNWRRLWKGFGIAILLYGAALLVGAASGGSDVWRPLQGLVTTSRSAPLPFRTVTSVDGLLKVLTLAGAQGRPVMLNFYADWCVECKELERRTFQDPHVRAMLRNVVLVQADVTAYASDPNARELLSRYRLIGPPAILFFNVQQQELSGERIIGFVTAADFVRHLRAVFRA